jgi:hypothetical protein
MPSVGQYQRYISQGEAKVTKLKSNLSDMKGELKGHKRGTKPFIKLKAKITSDTDLLKVTQVKLKDHKASLKIAVKEAKAQESVAAKKVPAKRGRPAKSTPVKATPAASKKRGRPAKENVVTKAPAKRGRPKKDAVVAKASTKATSAKGSKASSADLEKAVELLSIKVDALAEMISSTLGQSLPHVEQSISTAQLRRFKRSF